MASSSVRLIDGSSDFSGGTDSSRVPTIQSAITPHGLSRNQLAWQNNCTVRGAGISPRAGWKQLLLNVDAQVKEAYGIADPLFQGGWMYEPRFENPYLVLSISGHIYKALLEAPFTVTELFNTSPLTETNPQFNPPFEPHAFFCQAEEFLVIQAGDLVTLPLFWDGANLTRSRGLFANALAGGTFTVPAIGQPVLITNLANAWDTNPATNPINQIYLINGHHYQQILSTQRVTITPVLFNPSPGTWSGVFPQTFPAGLVLPYFSGTFPAGTSLVAAFTSTFTNINGNLANGTAETAYVLDASGTINGESRILNYPVSDFPGVNTAKVRFPTVANPLAVPGTNEVWMVNLDDPNAGSPVSFPIEFAQIPAAGPMDYYMGRLWYAQVRQYCAGDIVGSQSTGTFAYGYRDSVLAVTENPLAIGGDGFIVPSNAGNIRALAHTSSLDAALGQGNLYIFTQKAIYKLVVPVTRLDWLNADSNNQPLQSIAQQTNGSVNARSITPVNGDLFYRSLEPSIRSLALSVRNFGQWGNTSISNNENRIFQFENRALLIGTSGISFENRLLETCLPVQTPGGIVCSGVIPLDFDLISTLQEQLPPAWEGILERLLHYQLFQGVFGGLERAFSVTRSEIDGSMQIWELSNNDKWDNQDDLQKCSTDDQINKRIEWGFETPSFTFGKEFEFKRLDGGQLYFDKVFGRVEIIVEYRPDAEACWNLWHATSFCVEKNDCETVENPTGYPYEVTDNRQGYKMPLTLPKPPLPKCGGMQQRPVDIGLGFQVQVKIKGFCRVRGLLLFAVPMDQSPFSGLSC